MSDKFDWEFWCLKCLEWIVWYALCGGVAVMLYAVYTIFDLIF